MPLPGGPADKIGNRYEQWWTVSQFVRIIDGQAESIRIEDPAIDKAEFVITAGDCREFHQVKRSHLRGQWSLSELGSPKHQLLQTMFKQLSATSNTRFIFVSGSDAPELRELTERAVDAENLEEFESEFVSAKSQKEALEKLKRFWDNTDTATAYKILQRIEVHTRDERGIEDLVRVSLSALFLTKPGNVCDALRSFAQDSIHRVVNRERLISYLEGKGFTLRRLANPGDAPILISEATDHYLKARRMLIQDSLIPRSSTQELLAKIDENETSGADCVLTGKAGGGKTGCVIECVKALQQSDDVAVLAFRLDRIKSVSSTKELGECLGLEESPALLSKTAAEAMSRDAVLVIDQLDAVSTTSGRRSDFFEVVEDLLDEVRGLRNSVKFHVIVVCRKFDWENDHRLRRPLGEDCAEVSVTDFSMDEVKSVLQNGGFKAELFETKQLALLRLPQNLSLFLDTNCDSGSHPTFLTQKDLLDRYWDEKRRAVQNRIDPPSDHWMDVIQVLCDKMTASQQLLVSRETLDEFPVDYRNSIVSEGVLSLDQNHYSFGLLRAYTAGAKHFADEAVSELCDKTWRFECGYSGSPYRIAIQLIEAIAPHCSDDNHAKLEEAILDYTTDYERSSIGYKERGYACFALLSGIPDKLRSQRAQARYAELERKFGKTDFAPEEIQVREVVSPIEESAAEKMTDEQWLQAIKSYNLEREFTRGDPLTGGARELARSLQGRVQEEPERFARLSLRFPSVTNPVYIEHTLRGLKETNGFTGLKLEVCRKAYSEFRGECGKEIAKLLGSIKEPLPDDAVQMLIWLATEHPDPEKELWNKRAIGGTPYYGGDILNCGINTARGCAAWAIGDLVSNDASYIDGFRTTIERLVRDRNLSVRACAASVLLYTANHDWEFYFDQFSRLIEPQDDQTHSDCLLANSDVYGFIYYGLRDHFGRFQDVIARMLRSELSEISEAGARLASLAVLYQYSEAEGLVEEALRGNPSQRRGVAQVASANIGDEDYRSWAEQKLLLFFNDPDSKVREEAVQCFQRLQEQPLESYANLINKFCDSAAYQEGSFYLFSILEESSYQLPSITYIVCKKFLDQFSDEAGSIGTSSHDSVAKLVLRTYHQHQSDEWAPKCLELIDQMCLERMYGIGEGLKEYER